MEDMICHSLIVSLTQDSAIDYFRNRILIITRVFRLVCKANISQKCVYVLVAHTRAYTYVSMYLLHHKVAYQKCVYVFVVSHTRFKTGMVCRTEYGSG